MMRPTDYLPVLDVATEATRRVELPEDHDGAHDLLDAVWSAQVELDRLGGRLQRLCIGDPNRFGICSTCGKSLRRPDQIAGPHNPDGGCLFLVAPAAWLYRAAWHACRAAIRLLLRLRYHAGLVPVADADLGQQEDPR